MNAHSANTGRLCLESGGLNAPTEAPKQETVFVPPHPRSEHCDVWLTPATQQNLSLFLQATRPDDSTDGERSCMLAGHPRLFLHTLLNFITSQNHAFL